MTDINALTIQADRLAEHLSKFDETLGRYPDLTLGLSSEIRGRNRVDAKALQKAIAEKARQGRQLRVGIIGRVKAGKSSLLNALLFDGVDVLPKAATPMTASLTVLTYGDVARAEIEPFNSEDLQAIAKLAADYDVQLKSRIEARTAQQSARPASFGGRPAPALDPARIEQAVRRELDQDPRLGGAKDMHERILKAGGMPANWTQGKPIQLKAKSIAALREDLADYVGANGRFTPFTDCLRLYLPLPSLKDLEIVDTPGVNDPIPSRETRTYRELHRCDAVLVISPAGQFMNAQDLDLMDRLGKEDGVREVFLVASQVDSQLFGSVHRQSQGQLLTALTQVQGILSKQAEQTLAAQRDANPGVATLLSGLQNRLVVTSSVAHALSTQPESDWDANTRHVQQMLTKAYPAAFAAPQNAKECLTSLAGMVKTQRLLEQVRADKEAIQASSASNFLQDRVQQLTESLATALGLLTRDRHDVEAATSEGLEGRLKALQVAKIQGIKVVNLAVQKAVAESADKMAEALAHATKLVFSEARQFAERARGTDVETYKVDSEGFFAMAARAFSLGGQETRTRTLHTVKAGTIRNALEGLHLRLEHAQADAVAGQRRHLRKTLVGEVLGHLREAQVLPDRDIDHIALEQACLSAVGELRSFDDPKLPVLPDALTRSGTLTGSAADDFVQAAEKYLHQLEKAALKSGRELATAYVDKATEVDVGYSLFSHYEEELQLLKKQIKEKAHTLSCYDSLITELKQLQHAG